VRVFVFKPDGIGDFVLATGAIRLLAREFGEENLTLCVKTILAPLARDQFPRAEVLELPTASERKVLNLFVWNFLACLPLWGRLRARKFDAAVCFRSMRNYLETYLFYSARAKRFVACENILLRSGRKVRTAVEGVVRRLMRPELVFYPEAAELPLEIEANRVVVERLLGRPVAPAEVLPQLRKDGGDLPPAIPSGGYWLCAPITNLQSKVYPFAGWREILAALRAEAAGKKILLVGVASDVPKLEELRAGLREDGAVEAEIHLPADLAAFVRVIAGAEVVISVDTAAAHFATALDRPTVVLFSGLHLGMFGPWHRGDRQTWLLPDAAAEGTKKRKWHTRLSPVRAAEAVRSVLNAHESCS
jgi:ADP-heptose:LPS heptosyltransferase